MSDGIICDLCGIDVPVAGGFVVRIDVFADPAMPPIDTEMLDESNPAESMEDLIKQMQTMTADELQDGVHRRFEYRLCAACHKKFLANPLGKPRRSRPGKN